MSWIELLQASVLLIAGAIISLATSAISGISRRREEARVREAEEQRHRFAIGKEHAISAMRLTRELLNDLMARATPLNPGESFRVDGKSIGAIEYEADLIPDWELRRRAHRVLPIVGNPEMWGPKPLGAYVGFLLHRHRNRNAPPDPVCKTVTVGRSYFCGM